jgi:hypothetical protein
MVVLEKVLLPDNARYNIAYKNAVKVYDKFNNFFAYDSSNYDKFPNSVVGQRRNQIFVDNLSFLDNYKPSYPPSNTRIGQAGTDVFYDDEKSFYSEFNIFNIKVKTINTSMIDIDLISESSLARLQSNIDILQDENFNLVSTCYDYLEENPNYIPGGTTASTGYKYTFKQPTRILLSYSEMDQRRNIFNINCRLTPILS